MNPLLFLIPERLIANKAVEAARSLISHVQQNRLEEELRTGRLPIISNVPILLGRGETCHWVEPGVRALEAKPVTVARGSAGISVRYRLAPGLSVGGRVGTSAPVKSEQLVTVAQGHLVISNKRLVIAGLEGTLEIPFSKLITCQNGGDCVTVATKSKQVFLTGKGMKFALIDQIIRAAFQSA